MNVLITGYNGFVGKNLTSYLKINKINIFKFGSKNSFSYLEKNISKIDLIFHLAGQNRANKKNKFEKNNNVLAYKLIQYQKKKKLSIPMVFTSTIKVKEDSYYGITKKKSEDILYKFYKLSNTSLAILRLPNLYGKWSRPNYNSVVATFCHNISRKKKVISNNKEISLFYIDDLVKYLFKKFITNYKNFKNKKNQKIYKKFNPIKTIKVNELEKKIKQFDSIRDTYYLPNLTNIFDKKLYSTYLTYIPKKKFTYNLIKNEDNRGLFCEVFKHNNFGQISFLTINPRQTRGEHFHNTKVEKFLLISGKCTFQFKDQNSKNKKIILCDSKKPKIVETIPGWVHKIYNSTNKLAIVMIWTNEVFDANNPDTYAKIIK
ncbi:NAD-dependent epimerase/dehydratase family protein [Candidatus Pelagibacter sp.]|nr:NAD-dependent epimerase/dehydratase family protein [Candidatus Pelagibacter sp.]